MLYELATDRATTWEVAPRFEDLLQDTAVEFVHGEIRGLDEEERTVTISTGGEVERKLPYDWCVLAFGLQPDCEVPGVAEHATTFATADDALELKRRLALAQQACGRTVRVGVVGGGYVGVELAANLASSLGEPSSPRASITLVHSSSTLLPAAQAFSREQALRRLEDVGVDVRLRTAVTAVHADRLELIARGNEGTAVPAPALESLPVDVIAWTAGVRPVGILEALAPPDGLPLDARGRIVVDESLRVRGHPRLWALGDAASVVDVRGVTSPPTAQAAMQQADYVAWNVRAAIRSEAPLAFRYENLGEMLSLGEGQASIAALAEAVRLDGPLASAARRAVYAARMPTPTQAARVGLSWAVDAAFGAMRTVVRTAAAQSSPSPKGPPQPPGR